MGIPRPTGEYAGQMLEPGGWPESDEDAFYDRAQEYNQMLRKVTDVKDSTRLQQVEVFDGGVWSGGAANAANGALGTNLNEISTLQDYLVTVITWHRHIGGLITQAKSDIGNNVDGAQRDISILENDTELDAEERQAAIDLLVRETHQANTSLVAETAEQVLESKNWKPPHNALEDLLRQIEPTTPEIPHLVVPAPDTPMPDIPASTPFEPVPANPYDPIGPSIPVPPFDPANPNPVAPVAPLPPLTPVDPATPITPGLPVPPGPSLPPAPPLAPETPVSPNKPITPVKPVTPGKPDSDNKPVTPVTPGTPVTPTPAPTPTPIPGDPTPLPPAAGPGPAPIGPAPDAPSFPGGPSTSIPGAPGTDPAQVRPAAAVGAPPVHTGQPAAPSGPSHRPDDGSPAMAPAAATGVPAAARGSSGGLGATAASAGSQPSAGTAAPGAAARGVGGRAPTAGVGKAPASAKGTATPRVASARTGPPPARPAAPLPDGDTQKDKPDKPANDVTAIPSVPVSAARAARDAVAAAASGSRKDPLRLARRIAAALNAKDSAGHDSYGFFWITAVTTDGEIVVANSYGLAYIPEGVELPAQVYLASADPAIPLDERAHSATYPIIAVQTWAAYHDFKLRAVIGTAEQLAGSDPGVAKIVLEDDDIPDSGKMVGRPRLEVVDPSAAAQLAETDDLHLVDLLPPAPADAKAPDDQRNILWFDLMRPMTSTAIGRASAHLRAFRTYATHCEERALHLAYSAADPETQRGIVTDFLYWKYVAGLLASAVSETS